jgi:hypothetical protein
MALQLGALRDALIDAGASEDKAQRAAEELAGYQSEFTRVRDDMRDGFTKVDEKFARVDEKFARVDQEFAAVRSDMRVLKWQVGLLYAITGPTLLLLLRVAAKVGAFG